MVEFTFMQTRKVVLKKPFFKLTCLFSQSPISNFVGGKLEVESLLITVLGKNHKNKCSEKLWQLMIKSEMK